MSIVIRYLFDPLCGWCYGAARGISIKAVDEGKAKLLDARTIYTKPQALLD